MKLLARYVRELRDLVSDVIVRDRVKVLPVELGTEVIFQQPFGLGSHARSLVGVVLFDELPDRFLEFKLIGRDGALASAMMRRPSRFASARDMSGYRPTLIRRLSFLTMNVVARFPIRTPKLGIFVSQ
jgi:hypothetical protein